MKLPVNAWQLFFYARNGFWPLLCAAVVCTVVGQPGLLIVFLEIVGTVVAIIKFRSTFFIALEVSGLFIALALCRPDGRPARVEFVQDPLGLKASTKRMQKRATWRGGPPARCQCQDADLEPQTRPCP